MHDANQQTTWDHSEPQLDWESLGKLVRLVTQGAVAMHVAESSVNEANLSMSTDARWGDQGSRA